MGWWSDDGEQFRDRMELCRDSMVEGTRAGRTLAWSPELQWSRPGDSSNWVRWSRRAAHADQQGNSEWADET